MQETIIELINDLGYFAIAFLIFIENVFPPIPSEVILLFGGFMTLKSSMSIPLVIVSATIGSVLGAAILYLIGRLLNMERLKKLIAGRFGKITRLKIEHIEKANEWFEKYEGKAVLICRCVPIVRSLISIPAGMAQMKPLPFFLLTAIGSLVWNTVITILGAVSGEAWEKMIIYIDVYGKVILGGVVILAIIAIIIYKIKKERQK